MFCGASFERGDIVFNTVTGEMAEFFKEADVPGMNSPGTSKYAMVNAFLPGGNKVARMWPWTQTVFYEKKKEQDFPFTFLDEV